MDPLVYKPQYNTSWALIIGINNYQYINPLSYACNDANAISDLLKDDFDFPNNQVIVLKNDQATKDAILRAYHSLSQKAGHPDDRVLVFYAGHGHTLQGARGSIGFLVPFDGNPDDTSSLIRWDDLTRHAELIPAKHLLFIMDACYSGLAMQRGLPLGPQRFLTNMLQRPSRQVITAGKANEAVADGGGPQGENSIFTGYLIEGLRGAAVDQHGVLTATALMHYVYSNVAQDPFSRQTPHYGHIDGDGDFVFKTPEGLSSGSPQQQDYLLRPPIEHPEVSTAQEPAPNRRSYLITNGYGDPTHPNFGSNQLSVNLGQQRYTEDGQRELIKAYSWLSVVIEPASPQPLTVNIQKKSQELKGFIYANPEPYKQFQLPRKIRTTSASAVFYDETDYVANGHWGKYFVLNKEGNIEYAVADRPLFYTRKTQGCFSYVQVVGTVWRFLFFAKYILESVGYLSGALLTVNLVGTKGTILDDFSNIPGENNQRWRQPLSPDFFFYSDNPTGPKHPLECSEQNLQVRLPIIIGSMNEDSVKEVVVELAEQLGLAYNHQSSPRCFNYNTDIFPWEQFRS
jgi:hypothetical protein